ADQNVHVTELIVRRFRRGFHGGIIANVAGVDRDFAAFRANRDGRCVEFFLFAADEHDARTVFSETLRHPLSDSATASSDESGLVVEEIVAEYGHDRRVEQCGARTVAFRATGCTTVL